MTRTNLIDTLQEKRSVKTTHTSNEMEANRAVDDPMFEFVKQVSQSAVDLYKFNDMTDHDIECGPA